MSDRAAASDTSPDRGHWESAWDWVIDAQATPGQGALRWAGEDTFVRPTVVASRRRLHRAWRPSSSEGAVLILHGGPGPWRDRVGAHVVRARAANPTLRCWSSVPLVWSRGPLRTCNPLPTWKAWWLWRRPLDLAWVRREMVRLHMGHRPFCSVDLEQKASVMPSMQRFRMRV